MSKDMRLDSLSTQTEDDHLWQNLADQGVYARCQDALTKILREGNAMEEKFREEMEIKLFHLAVAGDLTRMWQFLLMRSPLHLAADRGFTEAVKYLLSNSATPDLKDNRAGGDSGVTLTSKPNHEDTVLVLQSAGAGDFQLPLPSQPTWLMSRIFFSLYELFVLLLPPRHRLLLYK